VTRLNGLLVAIGVFNQVTAIVGGHRGLAEWNATPVSELDTLDDRRWAYMVESPLRVFETKLWDFRDNQYLRAWRGLYYRHFVFPQSDAAAADYREKCNAHVVSISGTGNEIQELPLGATQPQRFWNQFHNKTKFIRAKIHNDGTVPLFGYKTGLLWGRSAIVHQVVDQNGTRRYENGTVHIPDTIYPGETGDALGILQIPLPPGLYMVNFKVAANGIGFCGSNVLAMKALIRAAPN